MIPLTNGFNIGTVCPMSLSEFYSIAALRNHDVSVYIHQENDSPSEARINQIVNRCLTDENERSEHSVIESNRLSFETYLSRKSQELDAQLDSLDLFSEQYFKLIECHAFARLLHPKGLYRLPCRHQKEFAEIYESFTGSELTSKAMITTNPNTYIWASPRERYTPLDIASLHGSLSLFQAMLTLDPKGVALVKFGSGEKVEDMEKILAALPFVTDRCHKLGERALHMLVDYRHYELLDQFLAQYKQRFTGRHCIPNPLSIVLDPAICFDTALNSAVERHDYQTLKIFIAHGFQMEEGKSPLEIAARHGDHGTIKTLLSDATCVRDQWIKNAMAIADEQKNSKFMRMIMGVFRTVPTEKDYELTIEALKSHQPSTRASAMS